MKPLTADACRLFVDTYRLCYISLTALIYSRLAEHVEDRPFPPILRYDNVKTNGGLSALCSSVDKLPDLVQALQASEVRAQNSFVGDWLHSVVSSLVDETTKALVLVDNMPSTYNDDQKAFVAQRMRAAMSRSGNLFSLLCCEYLFENPVDIAIRRSKSPTALDKLISNVVTSMEQDFVFRMFQRGVPESKWTPAMRKNNYLSSEELRDAFAYRFNKEELDYSVGLLAPVCCLEWVSYAVYSLYAGIYVDKDSPVLPLIDALSYDTVSRLLEEYRDEIDEIRKKLVTTSSAVPEAVPPDFEAFD